MITNDNLRLFVDLQHGLKRVRILAAREFGPLAIMGVAEGTTQLQDALQAGDIDHYIICHGEPLLGGKVEAVEQSPKAMVERLEKAVRNAETLPNFITVCSSTMKTDKGLKAVHEWFEANKRNDAAATAG
jgi:hypothetical protein